MNLRRMKKTDAYVSMNKKSAIQKDWSSMRLPFQKRFADMSLVTSAWPDGWKQDGRCLLCRFVLFHMRTVEVNDDDFVLAAAPRVILHDDDSSEDSVDQSNSDRPIEDEEAVLSRAIATFDAARPRISDEIDEIEATQPGFGGVASIRRRGALADFELYHDLSMKDLDAALRAASGGHELPELLPHIPRSQRVLTREPDKALLEQIQDIGAFTQP